MYVNRRLTERRLTVGAQRLQRRRDAMYELAERSAIYARQIEEVTAGGLVDETLLRRLRRLCSSVSF